MLFQSPRETLGESYSDAFSDMLNPAEKLKIFTKDGNVSLVSRDLVRFFSPLVNSILKDIPCCTSSMIFMPDVSKGSVELVLSIISSGIAGFTNMSIKQIQEVQETANMLEIDLTNMEYVENKSKVPDLGERNEKIPVEETPLANNNLLFEIKVERPEVADNGVEALLRADTDAVNGAFSIKEEPLDLNTPKPIEKSLNESPALFQPFLAPTPPSEPESDSSKSTSISSPRHEQYLHRVKSSKKGSRRSISEETMAALAKMMKDPKRKPTMEEMEELLSRTKSFKDSKPEERKRESPRSPDDLTRRSPSKDRRPRSVDRRSVSPDRRPSVQLSSSGGFPGVAQQSPAHFYMQAQHGQQQFPQYQHHPQMLQQSGVQPQIQYMVQPGGAVQAYVPGTVPVQYPYGTVQSVDHVQYGMVQQPQSKYRARSPSPVHRRSPAESPRYYDKVVKKSSRSMAEKKASLLTMTVEEKRLMTCLDWNSGLCPRLDSGKLCVFGGSKKKHICSMVIKSSKLGGSKVCWGNHREGEHPGHTKEREGRMESRLKVRRRSSRERR